MKFDSGIPKKEHASVLVGNILLIDGEIEIWNFPVMSYEIFEPSNFVGVWKIKQLKK